MLKIENLYLNIASKEILKDISLNFEKNFFLILLGENGSGKSMLLKTITGYYKNYKGSIFIEGRNLKSIKDRERACLVTYVSGDFYSSFSYKVYSIVEMGRYVIQNKALTENDFNIIKESMQKLDVWHLKDKNISNVSTGERMRIYLARALATEARILLLDEPLASLDIKHKCLLYSLINNINNFEDNEEKRKSIIMSMHDINDAVQLKTDMIMLKKGRIWASGKSNEIINGDLIKSSYGVESRLSESFIFY